MREVRVKLKEEEVTALQEKDCRLQTQKEVLAQVLELHALDNNTKVMDSEMVEKYQDKLTKSKVDFEKAKDAILNAYLDEETQRKVLSWSINYSACELIYTVD